MEDGTVQARLMRLASDRRLDCGAEEGLLLDAVGAKRLYRRVSFWKLVSAQDERGELLHLWTGPSS